MILLSLALGVFACNDKWNDYYKTQDGENSSASSDKIWDFIKDQKEYSSFVALMEETEVYKELQKDQILTLWAVPNEYFVDLSGKSAEEKVRIARHHINYLSIPTSKMEDGKIIKTIAGKNATLLKGNDGYTFNGFELLEKNMLCANGVVHSISGTLIVMDNIYEFIEQMGDEYSMFRDSILTQNDTVFRADLSFPIGVTETGNTVYDSIFVIYNTFLTLADIRDENQQFTVFAPKNDQWENVLTQLSNVYGDYVTTKDSIKVFDWFLGALFHEGEIHNYGSELSLYSVYDRWWKTDKQLVNPEPLELSNGLVYDVTNLHLPGFLLQKEVISLASDYTRLTAEEKAEYFTIVGIDPETAPESVFNPAYTWYSKKYFLMNPSGNQSEGYEISVEWTVLEEDQFKRLKPVIITPGKYKIEFAWRPYNNGYHATYVNGIQVGGEFNVGSKSGQDAKFFEMGELEIPESAGAVPLKVKDKWLKEGDGRIVIYGVKITPDKDNY